MPEKEKGAVVSATIIRVECVKKHQLYISYMWLVTMAVLKLEFDSFYQYWQLTTEHKIESLVTETMKPVIFYLLTVFPSGIYLD